MLGITTYLREVLDCWNFGKVLVRGGAKGVESRKRAQIATSRPGVLEVNLHICIISPLHYSPILQSFQGKDTRMAGSIGEDPLSKRGTLRLQVVWSGKIYVSLCHYYYYYY